MLLITWSSEALARVMDTPIVVYHSQALNPNQIWSMEDVNVLTTPREEIVNNVKTFSMIYLGDRLLESKLMHVKVCKI